MILWRESHIWSRNELLFSNYNNDLKMSLLSFKRGRYWNKYSRRVKNSKLRNLWITRVTYSNILYLWSTIIYVTRTLEFMCIVRVMCLNGVQMFFSNRKRLWNSKSANFCETQIIIVYRRSIKIFDIQINRK